MKSAIKDFYKDIWNALQEVATDPHEPWFANVVVTFLMTVTIFVTHVFVIGIVVLFPKVVLSSVIAIPAPYLIVILVSKFKKRRQQNVK